ncbi:hypothetical protein SRS16CHR_00610 [Variovorax sp. SRS16]|uniref:hypothetical protein n=1 Tax=Variovorax sp. SRS16 TaxID=282217 RepID=UPI00131999EC|nr:hypothetical protein [Variovorax sp. SRS16]VTU13477.1 hypothetical protein SRS16CHR_00610 [Variovorax sp. SRS16]
MKLIIRQYLSALRERGELDAVLPDLLSQLGLNVYSRPARGTRQDGVDVGAVGSLDGGADKVYLFSIKPGDLTRRGWNGESEQSLRPSLDDILDAYIPNRLPAEHRDKDIVICVTLGGDVQEQVRPALAGYMTQRTTAQISFEEWNGDKLAALIQSSFLREDLLPTQARSLLRKSLAMLDEPEVAFRHFAALICKLSSVEALDDAQRVTATRQMSICLWILLSWARDTENMEAAYQASELTLLHGWNILRRHVSSGTKTARELEAAFFSIFQAYRLISAEFLGKNVLPYADKTHAVSSAVQGANSVDVNLKLFDLLGRLSMSGIWARWFASRLKEKIQERDVSGVDAETSVMAQAHSVFLQHMEAAKMLILNNPALRLPATDDQAIDILLATLLLAMDSSNRDFVRNWLADVLERARFSYQTYGRYPRALATYAELIEHPKSGDEEDRKKVTSASILYPSIALISALLDDEQTYRKVASMKQDIMAHCTFQFWYPDAGSEAHFYVDSDHHGATLAELNLDGSKEAFLDQVFAECAQMPYFGELSAVKFGWWPLVLLACRQHRVPVPLQLFEGLRHVGDGTPTPPRRDAI